MYAAASAQPQSSLRATTLVPSRLSFYCSTPCAPATPCPNPRLVASHVLRVQLVSRGRQQRPSWPASIWPAAVIPAARRLPGWPGVPASRLWSCSDATAVHRFSGPTAVSVYGLSRWPAKSIISATSTATIISDRGPSSTTAFCVAADTPAHGHDLIPDGRLVQRLCDPAAAASSPSEIEQDTKHQAFIHHGTGSG